MGKAIWKIACSNSHKGGEEILKAYLAQKQITSFENKRPNLLAKCAADYIQFVTPSSIHTGQQIATLVDLPPHSLFTLVNLRYYHLKYLFIFKL